MQTLKNIVISGAMTLALLFGFTLSASAETLDEMYAAFEASKSEAQKERDRRWNLEKAERKRQYAEEKRVRDANIEVILAENRIKASKPIPKIGMSKSKVIEDTSWGAPDHINTSIYANGTHEQWIYRYYSGYGSSTHVSNTYYVYFINGKVTSIQY